jgi:prepilin-type N-terminal cleavage/methylation domain-containing protein
MKERGFSLIEVMIAVAILATLVTGMLGVIGQGFLTGRNSQQLTVAYSLAREILEEYSLWDNLDKLDSGSCASDGTLVNNTYSSSNQPACTQYVFNSITLNNVVYAPRLMIANGPCISGIPCVPSNQLHQLTVTISWLTNSRSFTTLKANY